MPEQFLHGVEIVEIDSGPRPITTVRSSVIGLVGTAPDLEADTASLTSGTEVAKTGLVWTADLAGDAGNDITIQLVEPVGNNQSLDVTVVGTAIEVSLATNGTGDVTSTAAQVRTAVNNDTDAAALLTVTLLGTNDGSGVLAAWPDVRSLAGGRDAEYAAVQASLTTGLVASNNALLWQAATAGLAGNDLTVILRDPHANSQSLSVSVSGRALTVNLATDGSGAVTTTADDVKIAVAAHAAAAALFTVADSGASTGTGVVAPLARAYSLSGGLDAALPLNTPVLVTRRVEAARFGVTGTIPSALDAIWDQGGAWVVVVRVAEGADEAATISNLIGNGAQGTGVHALVGAESAVHVTPRILIVPGFSDEASIVTELVSIATRLRAVIVADGPNSTDAAAITYRGNFGSDRVYLVDPQVKYWDTATNAEATQVASPRVAGIIAKSDNERGFWWSPSNREMLGITGTARTVDFELGDPDSRANYLNENEVATIIRKDGYRLWGNRSCAMDQKWCFLSVRRTADMIHESLLRAHLWAVDRNITKTYIEDVVESVNNYLAHLVVVGAIIGGRCWADEELNTPDQIQQGKVYFDFDFSPPYPAEHITFRSHLVNDYLVEILN